jgi:hypothetical protein
VNQEFADALARAFGLERATGRDGHVPAGAGFEAARGRRHRLVARAGSLSLRHRDGWTLLVCTDPRGLPTRAEVAGQYPVPEAIARLRAADERLGGALKAALAHGRNRHTRFVVRALAEG